MNKLCTGCGQTKDALDFFANTKRPDGLQFYCKQCEKSHRNERLNRELCYRCNFNRKDVQDGICSVCSNQIKLGLGAEKSFR